MELIDHQNVYSQSNHAPRQTESYCSECRDKLLSWTLSTSGTFTYNCHRDIPELLECAKHCRLCGYLCSLYGQKFLDDFITNCPRDGNPTADVWHSSQAGWDQHLSADGQLKYSIMTICLKRSVSQSFDDERREFTICTSAARAFHRPIWRNTKPIDFDARSSTIREWIHECDNNHQRCKDRIKPDSPVAARILSVQQLGHDKFDIKLVSTPTVDLHREKYIVLSHAWGDVPILCKTKLENISKHHGEGVGFDTLPPTFQDAVRITAAIGYQYLWIDSLCIVQDDEDDWQREAAKMASIFRFAALTVSATSARNSQDGCNLSKTFELANKFPGASQGRLDFAIRGPEYKDAMMTLQDQMRNSVLNTRAWVFQEQILSPRTLHAAHSQFVWQCTSLIESEDGLQCEDHRMDRNVRWQKFDRHPERLSPFLNDVIAASIPFELERKWWDWVTGYMNRTLKYTSDQYGAMAGVIRLYQELSNDEPILGLWLRDLALHLPWFVFLRPTDPEPVFPSYGTRRPSWTWMSYPHGSVGIYGPWIDWTSLEPGSGPHDIGRVYQAIAVETNISWSKEPLTSEPEGTITIRGICAPIPRPSQSGHGARERKLHLDPDVPESVQAREAFDTIALVAYIKTGGLIISPPSLLTFYLIIEPVGLPEENRYMRIGSMQIFRELPVITRSEYEPQGVWRDIVLV